MAEEVEEERKIVVAVDETEESAHAVRWSLDNFLSAHSRNVLILLYVRPPPPTDSTLDSTGYLFSDEVILSMDKYQHDMAKPVLHKAKHIINDHHHSAIRQSKVVDVKEKIVTGDARYVICHEVEELGAELLVVGSQGYGFIRRTLLGSVSDYCVRNASCPVMIVKRPIKRHESDN